MGLVVDIKFRPAEDGDIGLPALPTWPEGISEDDLLGPGARRASAISTGAPITFRFDGSDKERGRDLERLIREALELGDLEKRVKRLGELANRYPGVVLRHLNVHRFIDELHDSGHRQAVARITGGARPGRPYEDRRRVVAWVQQLCQTRGVSVIKAAEELSLGNPEWGLSPETIRNLHSRYRQEYQIESQGFYMDPEKYRSAMWTPGR